MNPKLSTLLRALESAGIVVERGAMGSPGSCDSYVFSAEFDDGGLFVETGNYFSGHRGGSIRGAKALLRVIRLLNLELTSRTAKKWNLDPL